MEELLSSISELVKEHREQNAILRALVISNQTALEMLTDIILLDHEESDSKVSKKAISEKKGGYVGKVED